MKLQNDNNFAYSIKALQINIEGAVQGVGFRPFVYRLAQRFNLKGQVNNSSAGVEIIVEGVAKSLDEFAVCLKNEKPPLAIIDKFNIKEIATADYQGFTIVHSDSSGTKNALMLPDIATCPDCLREIFDPNNRRYQYPFTNCTNCGPRYSIIEALPYDRSYTTMKAFTMCPACRKEYENPADRRFHAQPNACPICGPQLELRDNKGILLAERYDALLLAAQALKDGRIVALKGIGGFQLLVDARNDEAVKELRFKKGREEKPFAVMYQSLERAKAICEISDIETELLGSYMSPITLLKLLPDIKSEISSAIAPGNPYLGVMLPYTPLHHLLMQSLDFPVVATSGNLSDEPICIDNNEALTNLSGIADLFLIHNRPIVRHVDDSVAREIAGKVSVTRRARGYAPLPILLANTKKSILAVGAHLKNSAAISFASKVFITQHIGDLDNDKAYTAFTKSIDSLANVYEFKPVLVVSDKHPDYLSSKYADKLGIEKKQIQHHAAHIYSCMAENEIKPPVLGVAWDGTGLGDDGTIWGGEFFVIGGSDYKRAAHFRTFNLPGGDQAIKEPRRTAIALLYAIYGEKAFALDTLEPIKSFSDNEMSVIKQMLAKNINSPITSSAGRLFDAVSAILGIRQVNNFEGQTAMELEFAIDGYCCDDRYEYSLQGNNPVIINWEKIILSLIDDLKNNMPVGRISAKFHNTLSEIIVEIADKLGIKQVALSGGCFQNKYLTERTIARLKEKDFVPYWHHKVPTNDGGICLGQVAALAYISSKEI